MLQYVATQIKTTGNLNQYMYETRSVWKMVNADGH